MTEEEEIEIERRLGNAEAASRYWHERYEDEVLKSLQKDMLLMEKYFIKPLNAGKTADLSATAAHKDNSNE